MVFVSPHYGRPFLGGAKLGGVTLTCRDWRCWSFNFPRKFYRMDTLENDGPWKNRDSGFKFWPFSGIYLKFLGCTPHFFQGVTWMILPWAQLLCLKINCVDRKLPDVGKISKEFVQKFVPTRKCSKIPQKNQKKNKFQKVNWWRVLPEQWC